MIRHISNQELIVKSVLERDLNIARRAFLNDPGIEKLSVDKAKELFDEMIKNTKEYLQATFPL
jgi:alpha-galactosidase